MKMLERSILNRPRGGKEIIAKMISDWLNENTIIVGTHTIDDQFNIDVKGTVVIINKKIKEFPSYIKFNRVSSHFNCNSCSELSSLKGAPREVGGDFICSWTNLTSLEGAPEKVGRDFECWDCYQLQSLEGAPKEVGGAFDCSGCKSLQSLEGTPKEIGGSFDCTSCKSLYSLEGCPNKVGGYFKCIDCGRQFSIDEVRVLCKGEGDYIG